MHRPPRADLENRNAMGIKAIDPQSIRNVTIIGDPGETTPLTHRLRRRSGNSVPIHWTTGRVEHTIRFTERSPHAPIADLQRAIRLADGLLVLVNAATRTPCLETTLRIADDHQVARLCLLTSLEHPAADFDRTLAAIAATRGAVPLTVHIPLGTGPVFEGVIDLIPTWPLAAIAAEMYGPHWQLAEQRYHTLVRTVLEQPPTASAPDIPPDRLHHHIRRLTRIGDVIPILCSGSPGNDDPAPLLDAIARYLPSPLDVCQPEHALDY